MDILIFILCSSVNLLLGGRGGAFHYNFQMQKIKLEKMNQSERSRTHNPHQISSTIYQLAQQFINWSNNLSIGPPISPAHHKGHKGLKQKKITTGAPSVQAEQLHNMLLEWNIIWFYTIIFILALLWFWRLDHRLPDHPKLKHNRWERPWYEQWLIKYPGPIILKSYCHQNEFHFPPGISDKSKTPAYKTQMQLFHQWALIHAKKHIEYKPDLRQKNSGSLASPHCALCNRFLPINKAYGFPRNTLEQRHTFNRS